MVDLRQGGEGDLRRAYPATPPDGDDQRHNQHGNQRLQVGAGAGATRTDPPDDGQGAQLRQQQLRIMPAEQRLAKTTTLEGSAAPLTRVLRCDAAVSRREEKWLDGRLLITGEVLAAAHCADQNGGWQAAECTLPFELTIDCPEGADAEFDIRCRALAPTAEPMQDADGEYRALEWGVTISVEGKIYRAYALDCCTDGYSTRYQSACKGRTLQTVELVNLCRESETRRETLPLPEATGEVVALWARVEGCTAAPEGDGLLAEGRLGLTLLTKMGDGEYYSFDRTMELQRQLPGGEDCRWEAGLECRGCRWEQTGNELSLTCELVWQGAICRTRRLAVLEDITVDEAAPKENRMPRGLYIYMAEEGESLWEVARRYNTSEARIREDNGEMGECCPAGPLLIPV